MRIFPLIDTIIEQEQVRGGAFAVGDAYTEVYRINGPIDLTGFQALVRHSDFSHLREKPITPEVPRGLRRHGEDLLSAIRRRDILLHHPTIRLTPSLISSTWQPPIPRCLPSSRRCTVPVGIRRLFAL